MFKPSTCPFGNLCIDPGNPSDCEVNNRCINFSSDDEKKEFDGLPDLIILRQVGLEIRFKTRNQLKFFLADHPGEYRINILVENTEIPIRVDTKSQKLEFIIDM
jgi:hypothetical protein